MKANMNETVKLLRSYHDRLVKQFGDGIKKAEPKVKKQDIGASDDNLDFQYYLEYYESDFDVLLCKMNEREKKSVNFEFLLISLSRIVPLVDKIIKRICDMNIGDSVIGDGNRIQAMKSAMLWLYINSTETSELAYQDISRLSRFAKYQITRFKRNNRCAYTPGSVDEKYDEIDSEVWGAHSDKKEEWLAKYRQNINLLLDEVFSRFEDLNAYFGYMRSVTKTDFEATFDDSYDKSEGYRKIYLLALNIHNIIVRRFTSFVKISDLNSPRGMYSFADFKSSTLSDSNFTGSDFSWCDFSDAVLQNCDLSVAGFAFCRADNADFSNSNMNSTSLIGANFSNANLTNVQLMDALFRDTSVDLGERPEEEGAEEKRRRCNQIIRDSFFKKLARANATENGETEAWRMTTVSYTDREIRFCGVLGDACRLLDDAIAPVMRAVESAVISDERLKPMLESFEKKGAFAWGEGIPITVSLSDATLTGAQMPKADFSHVDMSTCTLSDADVNDARFYYTELSGAAMIGTNFSSTSFFKAKLAGANLEKANLIGTVIIDSDLSGASFSRALLINSIFINRKCGCKNDGSVFIDGMLIERAGSHNPDINDAILNSDLSLMDSSFNGVVGSDLVISGYNADRSTWRNAELKRLILFNVTARWSIFDNTDMAYALIVGVTLHQGSLVGVIMPNSRFFDCDMSGTKLNKANLIGSRIERVYFRNADLSEINLSRTYVSNCVFSDVNFKGANISDAVFRNVVFEDVDFMSCIGMSTAVFENCHFADSCRKLEHPRGSNGKEDKEFMFINHHGGRVKFFRTDSEGADSHRYTSLTYYLK